MTDFEPTDAQGDVIAALVDLIGMSGVHRCPPQDGAVVLDLLPAPHAALFGLPEPFCVRVDQDGRVSRITDQEAGIDERPQVFGGWSS